jgi:phage terminase small subunit
MGRRGRHPDPNSKRTQAALARAKQIAGFAVPTSRPAAPAADIDAPASVTARPAAARYWAAHAPALAADGRLSPDRAETFGLLCHLFADCEQLGEQLAAEGWITATDKGQAASPVARLLRDSRRDYVMLAREFGLTAASAARIPEPATNGEGEQEVDEEDALLAKLRIRGA